MKEWIVKLRQKDIDFPVIRLAKGQWPLQPELTPGHPLAGDKLAYL